MALYNRVWFTTATTGTGTITVGSAVAGFQTPSGASIPNAGTFPYTIIDGTAWEVGTGTYTSAGTTVARSLIGSSTGALINLSGSASMFVTPLASTTPQLNQANTFSATQSLSGNNAWDCGSSSTGIKFYATNGGAGQPQVGIARDLLSIGFEMSFFSGTSGSTSQAAFSWVDRDSTAGTSTEYSRLTSSGYTGKGFVKSSSASAGVGYATGAGGAATQGTSRTTTVTLDKICGAITLFSAAGSTTIAAFTVNNSTVAATDVIRVVQKSGTDKYRIYVTAVGSGSFEISFATLSGTTVEQPVFNFSVIKGVAS